MKYLLDSSAVIDLLRGNENVMAQYHSKLMSGNKFFICPIIFYEVVRDFKVLDGGKRIENFLKLSLMIVRSYCQRKTFCANRQIKI